MTRREKQEWQEQQERRDRRAATDSKMASGASGGKRKIRDRRARGRRGEQLTSARDRQRLREREAAERDRVERMLANTPVSPDRRRGLRAPGGAFKQAGLRIVEPTTCPICGDARVVTDEVMHCGTLRLAECLQCEHRWTERPERRWVELGARMNGGGGPQPSGTLRSV